MQLPQQLHPGIFRAYDIRGIYDVTLFADTAFAIGLSIGSEARARGESCLVVGRDGRLSSPVITAALIEGLLQTGIDVIAIGAVPTPLLYFATFTVGQGSGVMVTGSHNPRDYNGFKTVIKGHTLLSDEIQSLYHRIVRRDFSQGQGRLMHVDITAQYIQAVQQNIYLSKRLKIVIDCGNGIAGQMAGALYRALGCEVVELFCDVDGNFPNHHPDPMEIKNLTALQQQVVHHRADIGLAFDGDADRLGVVTNNAEIIWPDQQMIVYAQDHLAKVPGSEIIYDVKCTRHLPIAIAKHGGRPLMWKTGHSFIKAKMREINALLAGEMSGHLFFKDRWSGFDDALYAGARMLEILSQTSATSHEIYLDLPKALSTPEMTIDISDEEKFDFITALQQRRNYFNGEMNTIDGVRIDFSAGFGLVRASNTTPKLVLRFEADNPKVLTDIKNIFRKEMLMIKPRLVLDF